MDRIIFAHLVLQHSVKGLSRNLHQSGFGSALSAGFVCPDRAETSPIRESKPAILSHVLATLRLTTMFIGIYIISKTRSSLLCAQKPETRLETVRLA